MKVKPLQIGNKIARLPLIQGGMGVGVSLSRLAGAVAKAGGVGIISTAQIGFEEPDFAEDSKTANLRAMRQELEKARTIARDVDGKCPGLVGFNIMVATRDYEDYVRTAADAGADVIISGAGLPVDMPAYVEGTDTKIAPIVSSEKAARIILKRWDKHFHRTAIFSSLKVLMLEDISVFPKSSSPISMSRITTASMMKKSAALSPVQKNMQINIRRPFRSS